MIFLKKLLLLLIFIYGVPVLKVIKILTFYIVFLYGELKAEATFSMVAMDRETNEAGSVLATCIPVDFKDKLADAIVYYTNGNGIMNVQARINEYSDIWYNTALSSMDQDDVQYTAKVINDHLTSTSLDPLFQKRQILTIKRANKNYLTTVPFLYTSNVYTGSEVGNDSYGVFGTTNNGRFTYAIAGNLLKNKDTITYMKYAFELSKGSLPEKLIQTIRLVGFIGNLGDKRCTTFNTSSNYAFLRTFKGSEITFDIQETSFHNKDIDATQLLQNKFSALSINKLN